MRCRHLISWDTDLSHYWGLKPLARSRTIAGALFERMEVAGAPQVRDAIARWLRWLILTEYDRLVRRDATDVAAGAKERPLLRQWSFLR
jgi:hypothetical protein